MCSNSTNTETTFCLAAAALLQNFRSQGGTFGENKFYNCAAPSGGLSGAGTQHCACNRLVIAAQVTALDSAIANITAKLKATGLWANTVFAFSGDNGGPESEARRAKSVPRFLRRALLMPQVNAGSLYRGGKRD